MTQANFDDARGPLEGDGPHKPADDKEIIYFEGSPLIRGELGKMILCILIAAALVGAAVYLYWYRDPAAIPGWAVPVLFAIAVLFLIVPWVLTRMRRYRISNYRIDFERGLLSKKIDTLELWHVDDISFQQGLLDRIFNVGQVTIISDDKTTPRLELEGLPNPRPIFDSLKQRVIAVKRQRGVIKMDVG
jgi:membrane protein YdbS with pleckstrin-like domain